MGSLGQSLGQPTPRAFSKRGLRGRGNRVPYLACGSGPGLPADGTLIPAGRWESELVSVRH